MSDSSSIGQILRHGLQGGSRDDSSYVKIISLPEKLERSDKVIRIKGEVTKTQKDGTIHIKTDQGQVIVKGNQQPTVQAGKAVEITIPKEADLSTAYIRPAPIKITKLPPQQKVPQVNTPYINTPRAPALTPQNLVQSPPIAVEYITTPAMAEMLDTNIMQNVASKEAFILSDVAEFTPLTSAVPSIIISTSEIFAALPADPLSFTPLSISDDGEVLHETLLNAVPDTIPLRHIAAKLISAPLQEPIQLEETLKHNIIQSVNIKSLSFEHIQIISIKDGHPIPTETSHSREIIEHRDLRAGETKAIIEGFTKEQHFPVLRLLNIPSDENARYILKTPVQDITRSATLNLESVQNTILTSSPATPSSAANAAPIIPASFFLTPGIWGSLQDIQTTLHQNAPQMASAFSNVIPSASTPNQMGAAALFFLAALRSGDVQSWLGEKAINALKNAGKGELITKLSGEMSSLARLNGDSVGADWRMLSLPMAWQNEIHKVVVHYRKEQEREQKDDKKSSGTTRFIMDLNLSNIGKVQVDGLFKSKDKRLDAVLRTEQSFSQSMKAEMRRIYKDALDETEITGELLFQDTAEHWVNINAGENVDFVKDV